MPEVISLLSSSEAGSPPRPKARQPSPSRGRVTKTTAFSSDDLFAPLPPARQTTNTNISRTNSRPTARPATDDVLLISDDEVTPFEDVHEQEGRFNNGPASKRRRLDGPDTHISDIGSPPNPAATRAPLQVSRPRRPGPSDLPSLNGKRPVPRRDWLDDDPFASSSPQVAEQPPPRVGNHAPTLPSSYLGDNPTVSSPAQQRGPQPTKASDRLLSIDDIDPFASSSPARISGPAKSAQSEAAWDPISSSAPLRVAADNERWSTSRGFRRTQSEVITLDDSENEFAAQSLSDDDLPDITDLAALKRKVATPYNPPPASNTTKPSRKSKSAGPRIDPVQTKKSSLEKAKEKEEKVAAREAEKERKRLEKERAREERVQEKVRAAALAEVNKIRTDKKVAAPEMIVDLPTTLDESVKLQAATLLRDLDVHSAPWSSPVENVVKWRRKVSSRYNDELGHWEPVPERIDREKYAMVVVPAAQFVGLVLGEEDASLESHVLRMKRHFPNDTIIYLVEGLSLWLRKNRNARNSQYVSAVRNGLEPPPEPSNTQQQRKRKNANPQTYIDEEVVETALLQLQVLHSVLIHHTIVPLETARWIAVFTQHISTVPYRRQRDEANDAGFCMETGQVRTGDGPRDTYVRMLQEISRVTAPIAYGIAAEFGAVPKLVKGLEEGGPLRLEKVRKSVNKEGEVSERTVGQAVSRRVCKIFLGRDETSTDI
ncbi:ERCC4 domain-containing protein [Chaetomium fimeti]|uniref:ERCC4 domain-containing protein n=1 Tax=Chaetomium fimeti TaxID=1854472 RepID=A0AAE0LQ01_9PEZI|nr:ERCC4 domain-containing protein [Chaetomium fimeti]